LDRVRGGYIEGVVSILTNSALFVLKIWAGVVTGSLALTADAWHTLSDSISSVALVIAVKLSSKKADKTHPFGYGRWEQIAELFIAFFLGIIAYGFLERSIIQLSQKESVEYGKIAVIVTVVSIITKELLAQFAFFLGRKTDNGGIRADGWHHRSDALSSLAVLAGILFAKRFWWIDSVLGAVISIMLFYAAYKIVKESIEKLLGEAPNKELIEKITGEVKNIYKDDLRIHHFHIHNYVIHKELTMHIRLDGNMSVENGHIIATNIENAIKEKFGIIATIHIEPLKLNSMDSSIDINGEKRA
jgi:cation diffusion facilitator family transporter